MTHKGKAPAAAAAPAPGAIRTGGSWYQDNRQKERGRAGMAAAQEMSIHILFDNGSNPFVRYNLTPAEFAKEVLKWDKTFILQFIGATGKTILHFKAFERIAQQHN